MRKYYKLLLLGVVLLCGCRIVNLESNYPVSQYLIQNIYIAERHEFRNSYVYVTISGDSTMLVIQPKRYRRALCSPHSYYQLMLEEVHQFRVPSGLIIKGLSETPYTITYRKKIVYKNGWLKEKTSCPIYFLVGSLAISSMVTPLPQSGGMDYTRKSRYPHFNDMQLEVRKLLSATGR